VFTLISGQVFHLVSERRRAKFQNMNEREASFVSGSGPLVELRAWYRKVVVKFGHPAE